MKPDHNNLHSRLPEENPFRVPENYLEELTGRIMSQIPEEQPRQEPQITPWTEKIKPFLYMAAMFAGLGLFFKVIAHMDEPSEISSDTLLVNTEMPKDFIQWETSSEEDEEYLDYLEEKYTDTLLSNELEDE